MLPAILGQFVRTDFEASRFGIISKFISPPFLNCHVMLFRGRNTAETYRELIAWKDHPDAFDWMHTQQEIASADGLCMLKIQENIYRFLVECCKTILHEIPETGLEGSNVPIRPEPPLISSSETGLQSLAVVAAEAPYRLPAKLELQKLLSTVAVKYSDAKDHV